MSSIYISAPASLLAILSMFLLLVMLSYLLSTEKRAPHILSQCSKIQSVGSANSKRPLISVIVAARNEEEKIAHCINSLMNQTYKNLEIIVVDDNSIDKTRSIAVELAMGDSRIRVISAEAKPRDWVGKSWPCYTGVRSSNGELLLFIDADSALEQHSIEYCRTYFEISSQDMFSISPRANLKGVWAKAALPLVSAGINLLYPLTRVNDQNSKRAYVFGTFIMVKKTVYKSIGGHEAVRHRIVEDAAIAQLAKSKGFKLQVMVGDGLVNTDWESDFGSVYQGLERVLSDSIRSYGLVSLLDAVLIFFLGLYPIAFIIGSISYSMIIGSILFANNLNSLVLSAGLLSSVVSVLLGLLINTNELRLMRENQAVGLDPFLYPLGFFLFMSAIVTSTFKISRSKGLEWKGLKYEQKIETS